MGHIQESLIDLSNGGQGLLLRFENGEYLGTQRQHTRDGQVYCFSTMYSTDHDALKSLELFKSIGLASFEEAVVHLVSGNLEGRADLVEEAVIRHADEVTFYRFDSEDGSVFWSGPSLRFVDSVQPYAEAALMQTTFQPECLTASVEALATPHVKEQINFAAGLIVEHLVIS